MAGSRNTTREWFSWYFQHEWNQRDFSCSGPCLMSWLRQLRYLLYYSTWVFQLLSWSCQIFDPLKVHHHWSLLQGSAFLKTYGSNFSSAENHQFPSEEQTHHQNECSNITVKDSEILHRDTIFSLEDWTWAHFFASLFLMDDKVSHVLNREFMLWLVIFKKWTSFLSDLVG